MAGLTDQPVLRSDQLTLAVRGRTLGPFTFDVDAGETVCLHGINGSGKSTAIRLALGLVRATHGTSRIFGADVDPTHPPRNVGFVPDRAEFWDWQDAVGNLSPFTRSHGELEAVLTTVGLATARGPVKRFSRGMRQRLSIARALLANSPLLVLDEPTIALDSAGIEDLVQVLERHRAGGGAVLVATHDAEFLSRLDARVVPVADGRSG